MNNQNIDFVKEAVIRHDISAIQEAATKKSFNVVDREGRTALFYAVNEKDLAMVKALLLGGAEVTITDSAGMTPLHFAARTTNLDIAKLLIEEGAALEAKDSNGNTPLSDAVFASKGKGDMIKFLLEAGANPDAINFHGVSPKSLANQIANFNVKQFFV